MKGQFTTLLKRELWEHRSLWIAPLVVAGIILIISILGAIASGVHFNMGNPVRMGHLGRGDDNPVLVGLFSIAGPLFIVSCITIVVYLLDCLYSERKDRSILFWKSLPVSDSLTVLSKFTLGMVVVPLGVYALTLACHAFMGIVLSIGVPGFSKLIGVGPGDWIHAQGRFLGIHPAAALVCAARGLVHAGVGGGAPRAHTLGCHAAGCAGSDLEHLYRQQQQFWVFLGERFQPQRDLGRTPEPRHVGGTRRRRRNPVHGDPSAKISRRHLR